MLCILKVIKFYFEKGGCCMRILVLGAGGVGGFFWWQISRKREKMLHFLFVVNGKNN